MLCISMLPGHGTMPPDPDAQRRFYEPIPAMYVEWGGRCARIIAIKNMVRALYTMNLYNGSDPGQVKITLFRKVQEVEILQIAYAVQTSLIFTKGTIVQVQDAHA